jgi:ribosome-binding factor A
MHEHYEMIMKRHILSHKKVDYLCAERSEDDGIDPHARPRGLPARGGRRPRTGTELDRKALQLCHQVAETLEEVLAECGDSVLQGLRVLDVEPAPDASRLLVTVAPEGAADGFARPATVQDHLSRASGHLRSEVAGAITRKRAPVLVYRVAASDEM